MEVGENNVTTEKIIRVSVGVSTRRIAGLELKPSVFVESNDYEIKRINDDDDDGRWWWSATIFADVNWRALFVRFAVATFHTVAPRGGIVVAITP